MTTVSAELNQVLSRAGSDGTHFLLDLLARAELERPVVIDADTAGTAVRPYTWLLNRIGDDGIPLSSAGYLPPSVVSEAMRELDWEKDWIGTSNREHHTIPVLELRESTQRLRLARKYRGRLLRTALGDQLHHDPARLWWHIAHHLPDACHDVERDAGVLLLLAVASRTPLDTTTTSELLVHGLTALGWRDPVDGRLDGWQAFDAARPTWNCLRRLDAIPDVPYGHPPIAPSPAGTALARAALLVPNEPATGSRVTTT